MCFVDHDKVELVGFGLCDAVEGWADALDRADDDVTGTQFAPAFRGVDPLAYTGDLWTLDVTWQGAEVQEEREILNFFSELFAHQSAWRDHEDAVRPKDESASGHDSCLSGAGGHGHDGGIGSLRKMSCDGVNGAELSRSEAGAVWCAQWISEEVVVVLKVGHLELRVNELLKPKTAKA